MTPGLQISAVIRNSAGGILGTRSFEPPTEMDRGPLRPLLDRTALKRRKGSQPETTGLKDEKSESRFGAYGTSMQEVYNLTILVES